MLIYEYDKIERRAVEGSAVVAARIKSIMSGVKIKVDLQKFIWNVNNYKIQD